MLNVDGLSVFTLPIYAVTYTLRDVPPPSFTHVFAVLVTLTVQVSACEVVPVTPLMVLEVVVAVEPVCRA